MHVYANYRYIYIVQMFFVEICGQDNNLHKSLLTLIYNVLPFYCNCRQYCLLMVFFFVSLHIFHFTAAQQGCQSSKISIATLRQKLTVQAKLATFLRGQSLADVGSTTHRSFWGKILKSSRHRQLTSQSQLTT